MYFSMLTLIATPWWITRRFELSIKLCRFSSATCLNDDVHDHTQFLMSWNIMLQHMLRPHHCLWDHKRRRRLTSPNDFDASEVCSAWSSQQHFYGFHLPFSIFKIVSVLPIPQFSGNIFIDCLYAYFFMKGSILMLLVSVCAGVINYQALHISMNIRISFYDLYPIFFWDLSLGMFQCTELQ